MTNGVLYPRSKKEVDEIIASMNRVHKKAMRSKKSAREFLIRGGFIKPTGGLTPRYGGE